MLYNIKNELVSVTVSDLGAELQSIKAADMTEYLWQGDEKYWGKRAINLFPFVARLGDGKYSIDGKEYTMKIHGFAKDSVFAVEAEEKELRFTLTDSEKSYAQYPRHFRLEIIYQLEGKRLNISFRVENADERTMYFGIGGHPGFNVPLKEGLAFSDYSIVFDKPCKPRQILFSDRYLLTGETKAYELHADRSIPLEHSLFDNDAIVLRDMERKLTISTEKDNHSVTVCFPQTPNVGFWHAKETDAPYVCVEPWVSLPAKDGELTCFEEKEDMVCLPAGESYVNDWYIEISY